MFGLPAVLTVGIVVYAAFVVLALVVLSIAVKRAPCMESAPSRLDLLDRPHLQTAPETMPATAQATTTTPVTPSSKVLTHAITAR